MQGTAGSTRVTSAALFGNASMAAVVLALDAHHPATAQEIADNTGIKYSLVRDVLIRLLKTPIVTTIRTGGSRGPLYYDPSDVALWSAAVALARAIQAHEAAAGG